VAISRFGRRAPESSIAICGSKENLSSLLRTGHVGLWAGVHRFARSHPPRPCSHPRCVHMWACVLCGHVRPHRNSLRCAGTCTEEEGRLPAALRLLPRPDRPRPLCRACRSHSPACLLPLDDDVAAAPRRCRAASAAPPLPRTAAARRPAAARPPPRAALGRGAQGLPGRFAALPRPLCRR
jgi:hypothetical protein